MYNIQTYKCFLLLPLILYIIIMYYISIKNIKNIKLIYILIILTISYILLMRVYRNNIIIKNKINPNDIDNIECIIGKCKSNKGFLHYGCFDLWHIYHMLFWILFGMLYPKNYLLVILLSVIWEGAEHIYGDCFRIEDIYINIIGYTLGSYIYSEIK